MSTLRVSELEFAFSLEISKHDSAVLGRPVAVLNEFFFRSTHAAGVARSLIEEWCSSNAVYLVSSRLSHTALPVSFFLEEMGFRFVEMVLKPFSKLADLTAAPLHDLQISPATLDDLEDVRSIAGRAFGVERFHIDPRLPAGVGDRRYSQWAEQALSSPVQQLLKLVIKDRMVGFFIVEPFSDGKIYWHLTAISPEYQGVGIGRAAWLAMLWLHRSAGYERVETTISARNTRVLNLYSSLNFRFRDPEMTFHWIPRTSTLSTLEKP